MKVAGDPSSQVKIEARRVVEMSQDELERLTADEVQRLRALAEAHWTSRRLGAVRIAIGALMACAAYGLCIANPELDPRADGEAFLAVARVWMLTTFVVLVGLIVDFLVRAVGGEDEKIYLQEMMTPLHEHRNAESQVRQCLDVAECRSYRDRVVRGGRQLIVRDLGQLQQIAEGVNKERYTKLLHGA